MYMRPEEVSGARAHLIMVQVFDTINPVKVLKTTNILSYQYIVPTGLVIILWRSLLPIYRPYGTCDYSLAFSSANISSLRDLGSLLGVSFYQYIVPNGTNAFVFIVRFVP